MKIEELSPEALGQYIQSHHEKTFQMIDVRQPDEYQQGHIPGAQLLPLPELMHSLDQLPTDKDLIFYCHSGGRSQMAAIMTEEETQCRGRIFNLAGGILSWENGTLTDYPRVDLFDTARSMADQMRTAMDLEKGAQRFYFHIEKKFTAHPWVEVFAHLAQAETAHARVVFRFLQATTGTDATFESTFSDLEGEILEGGRPLAEMLQQISNIRQSLCIRLVEMGLQIEYAAYDLYRTMTNHTQDASASEAFLTIAQEEKAHMRALARTLEKCSG